MISDHLNNGESSSEDDIQLINDEEQNEILSNEKNKNFSHQLSFESNKVVSNLTTTEENEHLAFQPPQTTFIHDEKDKNIEDNSTNANSSTSPEEKIELENNNEMPVPLDEKTLEESDNKSIQEENDRIPSPSPTKEDLTSISSNLQAKTKSFFDDDDEDVDELFKFTTNSKAQVKKENTLKFDDDDGEDFKK